MIALGIAPQSIGLAQQSDPTPTPDRLATPVVPENPTPIDLGSKVYYQNCMPCHGDRGQGLTDEWRQVWVADHRDCWARGCHGGRVDDEGFALAKTVPPVIGMETNLARYASVDQLLEFVQHTQPPQLPGALSQDDYRSVTLFLWHANGRDATVVDPAVPVIAGLGLACVGLFIVGLRLRSRRMH